MKAHISNNYMLSMMIANNILGSMNNNKPLMIWDYYPNFFTEEKEQYEEEQRLLEEQEQLENAIAYRKLLMERMSNKTNENEVIENDIRRSEDSHRSGNQAIQR